MIAGLWPFDFVARNHVQWSSTGTGLQIARQGQIVAAQPWDLSQSAAGDASFTIEIWLQPSAVCDCRGTILSWYDPSQLRTLRIQQSVADLVVRGNFEDEKHQVGFRSMWLDEIFRSEGRRFLTITAGPQGAVLYVDGVQARAYRYRPVGGNVEGRLVLGHSLEGRAAWAGTLLGMALYDHALSPEEVRGDFVAWTTGRTQQLTVRGGISGLYLFDQRGGDTIPNHAGPMPSLIIPTRFAVFRRTPLLRRMKLHRSDVKDAVINIAGFVPFGLLVAFLIYQGLNLSLARAAWVASFLGGLTSLLIESLQTYLPSRDPSLLDVANNLLGSALGAACCAWLVRRRSRMTPGTG